MVGRRRINGCESEENQDDGAHFGSRSLMDLMAANSSLIGAGVTIAETVEARLWQLLLDDIAALAGDWQPAEDARSVDV